MLLTAEDVADYQRGYALAKGNSPFPDRGTWWEGEGWNDRAARWQPVNLVVGQVPPAFQPWSVLSAANVAEYLSGYRGTNPPINPENWWYRVGEWDRSQGRAQRPVRADLPAPPFNEQDPTAPPPIANQQPGQPIPAAVFAQPLYRLLVSDIADYQIGWQAAATNTPAPYDGWWKREGYLSQQAGRPGTLPDGSTNWSALAPLDSLDLQNYGQGFTAKVSPPQPQSFPYWWRQGAGDALSGRGYQPHKIGEAPIGFPVVVSRVVVPPQTLPVPAVPNGFPTVELLATLFGKPVAYDLATSVGQIQGSGLVPAILQFGTQFRFIGDAPGSQREGFRLSGPNGPIARKVARLIAQGAIQFPDPRAYQLPAWVGTHLRNGEIKLLGRGELQSIGLWDQLLDTYAPAPFGF